MAWVLSGRASAPTSPDGAQDRQVVLRVEPDRVGVVRRPLAGDLDGRVVLARDHVGVRDHDAVPRDPAAALHPEAAGGAEHLHHAVGGRADLGIAGDLARWAPPRPARGRRWSGTGRSGRAPSGSGRTAAGSRSAACRITERWTGSRSSRAPGVWSATAPASQARPSPRQPTSSRAPHPVDQAEALAEPPAQVVAEHLEARGENVLRAGGHRRARRAARRASLSPPRAGAARAASQGTLRPRTRQATGRPRSGPVRNPRGPSAL